MTGRVEDSAPLQMVNALTIDVEDYFQVSAFDRTVPRDSWDRLPSRVERNTQRLLDVLSEQGVMATFFVLGWVADRFPGLVAAIAGRGHEIASHGYGHELVYTLTPDAFRADVRRAKRSLEAACGCTVEGYRAPSFSITRASAWALDVLVEEGYRYDASVFPIHHDRYGVPESPRHAYALTRPGGSLVEFPASTTRLASMNLPVAGGGYFRLLPYAWTRWGIRRVNQRERRPIIFYLHPWEIDPEQPRLPAGVTSRFRHYRNLRQTEPRLRRLLGEFAFAPVRTVLSRVELGAPVDLFAGVTGLGAPLSVKQA